MASISPAQRVSNMLQSTSSGYLPPAPGTRIQYSDSSSSPHTLLLRMQARRAAAAQTYVPPSDSAQSLVGI